MKKHSAACWEIEIRILPISSRALLPLSFKVAIRNCVRNLTFHLAVSSLFFFLFFTAKWPARVYNHAATNESSLDLKSNRKLPACMRSWLGMIPTRASFRRSQLFTLAQWLECSTRNWKDPGFDQNRVQPPAGPRCVFSSDPAVSSSNVVGEKGEMLAHWLLIPEGFGKHNKTTFFLEYFWSVISRRWWRTNCRKTNNVHGQIETKKGKSRMKGGRTESIFYSDAGCSSWDKWLERSIWYWFLLSLQKGSVEP